MSVPNIDDTINVQLGGETHPLNSRLGDHEDVDDSPEAKDKKILVSEKSDKKQEEVLTSNDPAEVRSMLEYLYLDVKVRSPAEVSGRVPYTCLNLNNNCLRIDTRPYR